MALGHHTQTSTQLPILAESQKGSCLFSRLLATEKEKKNTKTKTEALCPEKLLGFDTFLYSGHPDVTVRATKALILGTAICP